MKRYRFLYLDQDDDLVQAMYRAALRRFKQRGRTPTGWRRADLDTLRTNNKFIRLNKP
jgi:hypothetical protein